MTTRLDSLESRRQALLNRCEEQRLELAYQVAQITPRAALTAWTRRGGGRTNKNAVPWIAGAAGLLLMLLRRRRRRTKSGGALGGIGLVTTLVALATRASSLLRVLAQARALYLTYKATTRRPERH